jgi:hypothetical protein
MGASAGCPFRSKASFPGVCLQTTNAKRLFVQIGESPRERHFLGSSWRDGVDIFVFNLRRASNRFLVAAVSSGKTTCLLIFAARHGR